MDSLTTIKMKLDLFWLATGLPIKLYNVDRHLIMEKLLDSQKNINHKSFEEVYTYFFSRTNISQYYTNKFGEHYIYISFQSDDDYTYHVVSGPSITNPYDEAFIIQLMKNEQLSYTKLNKLKLYFNSLPNYSSFAMRKVQPLLYHLLTGKFISITDLFIGNEMSKKIDIKNTTIRDSLIHHHSDLKTNLILDAVKNADRKALFELLNSPEDGPFGILCRNNPLRSYKNLFITTVSEINMAAISGGVDSESAYTLSDTFIQFVEEMNTYEDVTDLFVDMFNAFIDLVEKNKRLKFSKPVRLTIDYIHKYYSKKIKVSEIAEKVHLSESHLLRLFKAQIGISIKDYMTQTRIEQAKKLLKYTQYNIATISEMTGFNDQSHLTRTFKKWVNVTPKVYRETIGDK
jgi:AraC-like DNA-binding protein